MQAERVKLQDGYVDLIHHRVVRGDETTDLTPIEVKLIEYLLQQGGKPVSRSVLLVDVWEYAPTTRSRAVDFAVRRLRFKIEVDPAQPVHLIAVPKVGYRFQKGDGDVVSEANGVPKPTLAGKHLPPMANAMLGRVRELQLMDEKVTAGARWMTLCGPPGIGKTRLAIGFANQTDRTFPGGIWLCDLQAVGSEAELRQALDQTFGRSSDLALEVFFENQPPFMLILDSVEHLVEWGAQIFDRWSKLASESLWVFTSRAALHLAQEQLIPVGPLQGDEALQVGVQMFVARAQQLVPSFRLDAQRKDVVERIVEHVQGVPLSIELAASRIRHLPPRQILNRLMKQPGFLSVGIRSQAGRHSTLDATLDWSWSLLSPCEQSALAQCAVFRGGFTFEAADSVLDLAEWGQMGGDVVASLVDQSLVRGPDWASHSDEYQILEFIREYAERKLKGLPAEFRQELKERHAAFFADAEMDGWSFYCKWSRASTQNVRRLHGEQENLKRAHHYALEQKRYDWLAAITLKLAERHMYVGWSSQHRKWLHHLEGVDIGSPLLLWNVARHRAWGAVESANKQEVPSLYKDAMKCADISNHAGALAESKGQQAEWFTVCREFEKANALLVECMRYADDADDSMLRALCHARSGTIAFLQGDVAKARARLELGVSEFRSRDVPEYEIRFGQILAEVCRADDDAEAYEREWNQALQRCDEVHSRLYAARGHLVLGIHLFNQNRMILAKERLEMALELSNRIGNPKDWARASIRLAAVYLHQGDLSSAMREYERSAMILLEAVTPLDHMVVHTIAVELQLAVGNPQQARAHLNALDGLTQWIPKEKLEALRARVEQSE